MEFIKTFLKTLIWLLVKPKSVFDYPQEYINHWKFSLTLGTTTILLVNKFRLNQFGNSIAEQVEVNLISERVREHLQLVDNFATEYGFQIKLIVGVLVSIPILFVFFEKARSDFKSLIRAQVYTSGVSTFLSYSIMAVANILGSSVKWAVLVISVLITIYTFYVFISFFGNKRTVYVRLIILFAIGVSIPFPRLNWPNLYTSWVNPEMIAHHTIVTSPVNNLIKRDPQYYGRNLTQINDTTILSIENANNLNQAYLVSDSIKLNLATTEGYSFFVNQNDTVKMFEIVKENNNSTLNVLTVYPSRIPLGTVELNIDFVEDIELLSDRDYVFVGRKSQFPVISIVDQYSLRPKQYILFTELENDTFDEAYLISDSTILVSSYQLFDHVNSGAVIIRFSLHSINLLTGKIIRSRSIFERTGAYGISLSPSIEVVSDSLLFYGYVVANQTKHVIRLGRLDPITLEQKWTEEMDLVNDLLFEQVKLKYHNHELYFLGTAKLIIHKNYLCSDLIYGFLGKINLQGNDYRLSYKADSFRYRIDLLDFFTYRDDLYFSGTFDRNVLDLSSIFLPRKSSFNALVADNILN